MRYREEVVLTVAEWLDVQDKLARLEELEEWAARQAEHDAQYLTWSLSPDRLTDALQLAEAINGGRQ